MALFGVRDKKEASLSFLILLHYGEKKHGLVAFMGVADFWVQENTKTATESNIKVIEF